MCKVQVSADTANSLGTGKACIYLVAAPRRVLCALLPLGYQVGASISTSRYKEKAGRLLTV
jgi:hypothetical protein